MWRIFSLAILALIPVGRVGAQDKRSLIVEVLQTAGDYGDIAPVWGIVQKDRISDRYSYRTHPISGERQFHAGLDMAAVYAATVHAAASGTVTFAGETPGYGKTVVVTHRFGFQTRYAHLTLIYTRKGAEVEKGDVIGFVGSTGISTGNHLHYEVIKNQKRINPLNFIYGTK